MIKNVFKTLARGIYAVINFLNLQFFLVVALLGLVFYFTGLLDKSRAVLVIFYALLIGAFVLGLTLTVRRLLGLGKNVNKKKGVQIISETTESSLQKGAEEHKDREESKTEREDKPVYFSVKDNPAFVMAEYKDRYELYLKKNGELIKVREDKKA